MAKDEAYRKAAQKIEEARRTAATELELRREELSELPESLGQLTQLQTLDLSHNQLTALPEWLGQLAQLQTLDLSYNQLTAMPDSLGRLTKLQKLRVVRTGLTDVPKSIGGLGELQELYLDENSLQSLPASVGRLTRLRELSIDANQLTSLTNSLQKLTQLRFFRIGSAAGGNPLGVVPQLMREFKELETFVATDCGLNSIPEWFGELENLRFVYLDDNEISELPASMAQLHLSTLELGGNPLTPVLAAAHEQGLDAVEAYLRAKAEDQIVLNEAKLILIGEGDVGKTSLLGALRGDDWVENRPTTHGVEVNIKTVVLADPDSGTEITFNGWDFGGQNIYRHTHQLFFTAPAVYLAVWNPRRGPEQCCVDEWIKMVRQRAFDETRSDERPRILVVATHGGPRERSAHIDEQLLRDEFGDLIAGFHHVNSKTGYGLDELKEAIAREAAAIPSVGRSVP